MMQEEASALGIHLRALVEAPDGSTAQVTPDAPVGAADDEPAVRALLDGPRPADVLTFEHELQDPELLERLAAEGVSVQPGPGALLMARDKLAMRRAMDAHGLPQPSWAEVRGTSTQALAAQVRAFASVHGWPVVLKTPRGGYDGHGVLLVRAPEELADGEAAGWLEAVASAWSRSGTDTSAQARAGEGAGADRGAPSPSALAGTDAGTDSGTVASGSQAGGGGSLGGGGGSLGGADGSQAGGGGSLGGAQVDSLLVEEAVPFTRELAVLLARRPSGQVEVWPVAETVQDAGMCSEVIAPAPGLSQAAQAEARRIGTTVAEGLGVTGVLAVEMFAVESPDPAGGEPTTRLYVNELAMRPHNSGHWTQDGAVTSQFAQHLRAVLDLPLGSAEPTAPVTVMANLLGGSHEPGPDALARALAQEPRAHVHLYGKGVRPRRKLGHVNLTGRPGEDVAGLRERARAVVDVLRGDA